MTPRRWIEQILARNGAHFDLVESTGHCATQQRPDGSGRHRAGRMALAVVDERPVALLFAEGRRVAIERLRKLLGADAVRLASCHELDQILGAGGENLARTDRGLRDISFMMDASLLSAPAVVIRPCDAAASVQLSIADWLAVEQPGLAHFTEPDRESVPNASDRVGDPSHRDTGHFSTS